MKVLIGTPAYGGLVNTTYALALQETIVGLVRDGIDYAIYMMANEALIQRARNKIASYALRGGYDRLVFIDADITWTYPEFKKLIHSPHPVIGGTYPLKLYPIQMNYNIIGKGPEYANRTPENLKIIAAREGDEHGVLPVRHIPTGFMAISGETLKMLKDKVTPYTDNEPRETNPQTLYDFFPVQIKRGYLQSEDWMFCEICADNGIPIHLDSTIILDHTGSHRFSAKA